MIWILYYFLIHLFVAGIRFSTLWNAKSRLWINGRKEWYQRLLSHPSKKTTRIWFHASSLGEFEQARPVIEKLKERKPEIEIILTFFSPSGYEIRAGYPHASVFYLPADLPGNAKKWISILQPDFAVFVKYDLWPGYLKELAKAEIPAILVSAHWTRLGFFNSWSLPPVNALLKKFKKIFLQAGDDIAFFSQKGFTNLGVTGDTRIDRSLELPIEAFNRIPDILRESGPFDLVAGSTWPPDEKIILEAIDQLDLRVLLAPHIVSEENLRRLVNSFPFPVARFSEMKSPDMESRVVIVDSIGILSFLYSIGKVAYVGGGFGSGIHNTLEPMAHRKPIIFGPSYKRFPEAIEMINKKGAISVTNTSELIKAIKHFQISTESEKAGNTSIEYLHKNAGASDIVTNYILDSIPFSTKK